MARVRILQAIGGLDFSWQPGQVVDLDDDEAEKWADGHRAEYADTEPSTPPADNPEDEDDLEDGEVYDPDEHPVKDVLAHLQQDTTTEAETVRILDTEASGQNRKGISAQREDLLQQAAEREAQRAQAGPAEVAADDSRGGGRGQTPETR